MSAQIPDVQLPFLPPNTIVPSPVDQEDIYIQYFNRLYEDIALAVNSKDFTYFQIPISDTAQNIPNLANFGAFIICVSGVDSAQPTKTVSLVKSSRTAAGVVNVLGTQAGTASSPINWLATNITVTSTASNFQINHDNAGVTANFNIRIIGTQ